MRLKRTHLPAVAALVFGASGMLAAAAVGFLVADFAREAGMSPVVMLAVPGLFAMLFALTVYQGAAERITSVGQSLSRGILVALLTWLAFSALASAVWCPPDRYGACFSNALLVSGIIGGAPMLIAALLAGYAVGRLVLALQREHRVER
jgi:hypothetical protein